MGQASCKGDDAGGRLEEGISAAGLQGFFSREVLESRSLPQKAGGGGVSESGRPEQFIGKELGVK